jgi:Tol biopolymer transport system component
MLKPQLWVVKSDGSDRHMLFAGAVEGPYTPLRLDLQGLWSNDGSVIHVVKYSPGPSNPTLCMPSITNVPIDGGPSIPVAVSLTNHDDGFVWSPDGTRIVYRHWAQANCTDSMGPGHNDVVVMNADGSDPHTIATGVTYLVTSWTPDGTALMGEDMTGRPVRVSLSDGHPTVFGPAAAAQGVVSPDGSRIAYLDPAARHLLVVGSDGTSIGSVDMGAASADAIYGPVWSPDGSAITLGRMTTSAGVTTARVLVMRPPSPTATVAYVPGSYIIGTFGWSPDGIWIAFGHHGGSIVVVKADGSAPTTLPGTSGAQVQSWQP